MTIAESEAIAMLTDQIERLQRENERLQLELNECLKNYAILWLNKSTRAAKEPTHAHA